MRGAVAVTGETAAPARAPLLQHHKRRNIAAAAVAQQQGLEPILGLPLEASPLQTAIMNNNNRRLGWSSTLEPQELLLLVDRVLGPNSPMWRLYRQQQQQRQNREQLLGHLTAETKPSSRAFNVGELAKLGEFSAALKLMEELAKQNHPEAFEMCATPHGGGRAWQAGCMCGMGIGEGLCVPMAQMSQRMSMSLYLSLLL